jgi:hypothetical protein
LGGVDGDFWEPVFGNDSRCVAAMLVGRLYLGTARGTGQLTTSGEEKRRMIRRHVDQYVTRSYHRTGSFVLVCPQLMLSLPCSIV